MPIERNRRQARIVVAVDDDTRAGFAAQQVIDVLAELVKIESLAARRASGAEHGIDEIRETVRLADDDVRVFAQRRVFQLPLQELRRAAQAAERILDLVSELPNHQP